MSFWCPLPEDHLEFLDGEEMALERLGQYDRTSLVVILGTKAQNMLST